MDGLISRVLSLSALRQPVEVGHVSAYGRRAVENLAAQRRVLDRLDWWSAGEWADSDAFVAVGRDHALDGALLAIPIALDDPNRLSSARSGCAWLRWCALADGVSGAEVMRLLLDRAAAELRQAGVRRLHAILEPTHWIHPYLCDAGYVQVDEVITLRARIGSRQDDAQSAASARGLHFRPARRSDLAEVEAVDASAFEEVWRFSGPVLERALNMANCFRVVEQDGAVVAYSFAVCVDDEAHVTRIAVRADQQRRGIGAALLADTLARLESDWGARVVTLNTQASNLTSQQLYRRFGFEEIQPVMRVLCRQLTP